jgi:hypothetical protein
MLHALYIPAVFIIGLVIGYLWGAGAAKQAIAKAQGDLKS